MLKTILSLFFAILISTSAWAENIQIITEIGPPLNTTSDGTEKGTPIGPAVDLVKAIQKKIGDTSPILVMPWARGYSLAQTQPNTMLFSTTKSEARENLFKWVGPIASNNWVFYAKKTSKIKITNLDDAKKVKNVGAYREDVREQFLKEKGFPNIDTSANPQMLMTKLVNGRNDLMISSTLEAPLVAKEAGINLNDLEVVYNISVCELYLTFSKATPDEIVLKWQKALNELKKDGTYKKIMGSLAI